MTGNASPMLLRARQKFLVHPTQRVPFDYQQWEADFKKYTDGGIADKSLCQGAGWLANHFSKVYATRDYYKLDPADRLSVKELVQMHLASANLCYVLLANQHRRDLTPESIPTLESMLGYKTNLTEGGVKLHPNQVAMFNLDSLCAPLFEILNKKIKLESLIYAQSTESESLSRFDFFRNEVRCAQLYHNGSIVWQQLLYGDCIFVHDTRNRKIVVSQLSSSNRMRAISDYRREHHQVTAAFDISGVIDLPILTLDAAYPSFILKPNHGLGFAVIATDESNEELLRFIRYKRAEPYLAVEHHLFKLLETKFRSDDGGAAYSVRDILRVWLHLSILASQVFSQGADTQPENWSELTAYCQWYDLHQLVMGLVKVTEMSDNNVRAILELLTFRGADRQHDLWAKPLVEVDGSVAFSISALLTANMRRNVDIWIQVVDPRANLRGKHFEESLESMMKECQTSNRVLGHKLKWTGALMLKYDRANVGEEVDLTFSFGNTIVIVEARSRRTPITPLDYHNAIHEDSGGILAKAAQVERKTAYVRKHLHAFCAQHYPHLLNDAEKVVVHPLVLVNDQFHAGFPSGKTPVLDESLLKHFLKDGRAKFMGSLDGEHRYAIVHYDTLEEAEATFFKYTQCPTVVEVHELSITHNSNLFDVLGAGELPVQWLSYEVEEPRGQRHLEVLGKLSLGRLVVNY